MATDVKLDSAQFEELMESVGSRHHKDVLAGRVFSQATTPLGLAIPIYTATTLGGGGMPVWNPPNSKVNVELISLNAERGSGITAFGAYGVMARKLDAIATGAIMTALAEVDPINAMPFSGLRSKVRSSNAGTNKVTAWVAADFIRSCFASVPIIDTTAVHVSPTKVVFDPDELIVRPGTLIYLAGTKDSVALFALTLVWKEKDI